MNARKGSVVAWLVAIVGLLIWEGIVLSNKTGGDTLSEQVWAVADFPLVPLLVGVTLGHFFWQRRVCKHCGQRPW